MRSNWKLVVCLLALIFVLTGCGEKVVAKVNGEKITEIELNSKVKQIASMNGYDLEGEHGQLVKGFLEEQMLNALIKEKLILQDAKAQKTPFDKRELKEEMKRLKEGFPTTNDYQEFLTANNLTEKGMEDIYRYMLIYNGLFEEVTKDITETSRDLEEYYQNNPQEFYQQEMVQVRHALVEKEEDARGILTALEQGEDFKKLAVEKSIDPSAQQNEGLLDYFAKDGYMVEEFEKAAFALTEIGEYTKEPVESDFGYHIIKLEGRKKAKKLTFDEIKDELAQRFLAEEKNEKFQEYEESLMAKAKIEKMLEDEDKNNNENEENIESEVEDSSQNEVEKNEES